MAHSNQMREFVLSDKGIDLVDVYTGPGAVYTGAARLSQEAHDQAEALVQQQAAERRQRELEQERRNLQAQAAALQTRLANIAAEQRLAATAGEAARRRRPALRGATGARTEGGLKGTPMTKAPKNPTNRALATAPLRRRPDAQVHHGLRQPQEDSARRIWRAATRSR